MDLFEHRYYRLSKNCMMLLGQWPCQSTRVRRGVLAVIIFVAVTGLAPLVHALVKHRHDWSVVLECVISCLFIAVSVIKLIGIICNSQKTLKLLDRILANWQVWARSREAVILHEYAEQGERMAVVYAAAIYSTIFLYTTQPTIPKIFDSLLRNGTQLGKFPYPVDYYYFDAHHYYSYIMMHFYVCACVAVMPLVASDGMLIISVQHVCSVFAALGRRLERLGDDDTPVRKVLRLSSFVDRHNDAIEYANLIEATYTWNFFFTITLGVLLVNILLVQIFMRTNEPESTVRFVASAVSLELVFYVDCSFSQSLVDHSINVGFCIYNSQWYRLGPGDQRLLQMMTLRCRAPCQLTAGKMLVMSMRNFGMTIRTAMSYFAVVRPK